MLNYITEAIKDSLESLHIFQKVFQYVELSGSSDGKYTPSEYGPKGKYNNIKYDDYNGLTYTRKNGRMTVENNSEGRSVCGDDKIFSWPLRIVAIIKKENYTDNCFTDDELALQIMSAISEINPSNDIGAQKTEVEIEGVETGNEMLIRDEYAGKDIKGFPSQYAYLAVDFSVKVYAKMGCLTKLCDAYTYTVNA